MVSGAWAAQSSEEFPAVFGAVVVGGVNYLVAGDEDGYPTVIEAGSDGSFTEYPLDAVAVYPKGVAVTGTTVLALDSYTGNVTVQIFDTVAKTSSYVSISSSVAGARYGSGWEGPDGLVYFAPVNAPADFADLLPLVFDPSDESLSFTDFSGTWVSDTYGSAVLGGDGLMYFLPGLKTVAGGTFFTGERIAVLNFDTMTISTMGLPLDPDGDPEDVFYWGFPSSDGVYAQTDSGIYRISLADGDALVWENTVADFASSPALGSDGRLYATGSAFVSSGHWYPVLAALDMADDSVTIYSFTGMSEYNFKPSVTYAIGSSVRAFPYSGSGFDPVFVASLTEALMSFAIGSVPVTLAIGAIPVTGWHN